MGKHNWACESTSVSASRQLGKPQWNHAALLETITVSHLDRHSLLAGSRSGETAFDVMIADCGVLTRSAAKTGTTAAMRAGGMQQQRYRQRATLSASEHLRCMQSAFRGLPLRQRWASVLLSSLRGSMRKTRPKRALGRALGTRFLEC